MPEKPPLPIDFAIQRVSWAGNRDERYENHSKRMNQVDIRGAYHYYSSGAPWLQQAELFLKNVVENPDTNYHMMWLDYEKGYNKLTARTAEDARKIVEYCAGRFDGRVGVYANPDVIINYLDPFGSWMLEWPLWVAQLYWIESPEKNPNLRIGRVAAKRANSAWDFFQYSWSGNAKEYGILGNKSVDLDVYNGTTSELKAWLWMDEGGDQKPEPKPDLNAFRDGAIDEVIGWVGRMKMDG